MFEDLKPGVTKLLHSIIRHLAEACQAMGGKHTVATDTAEPETTQAQLTKYIMESRGPVCIQSRAVCNS